MPKSLLILFLLSTNLCPAFALNESAHWNLDCRFDPVLLRGAPYSQKSVNIDVDFARKRGSFESVEKILPPFQGEPQETNAARLPLTAIEHSLHFPEGCFEDCSQDQDNLVLSFSSPDQKTRFTLWLTATAGASSRPGRFDAQVTWSVWTERLYELRDAHLCGITSVLDR